MSEAEEKEKRGLEAAVSGFAHEHITVGILMKRYHNVSLVNLPLSPYDIVIVRKERQGEEITRAQVKTAQKSISFTGGGRGGVDRTYKSGIKTYTQSTKTCDVVIGLHPNQDESFDLYFVPTILLEKINQKSITLKKIEPLKNNYNMLDRCKDSKYVISRAKEYGIIS